MIKIKPSVLSFQKTTIFSEKKEAVTLSSSLVIYSLICYTIYDLLVFSQTFINFE